MPYYISWSLWTRRYQPPAPPVSPINPLTFAKYKHYLYNKKRLTTLELSVNSRDITVLHPLETTATRYDGNLYRATDRFFR